MRHAFVSSPAQTRRLALGGVLGALIVLLTFGVRVPIPGTAGYAHPGDAVILLAGFLLGPYAALVGGFGSALADLLGGYFLYVPATLFIKGLMGAAVGTLAKQSAARGARAWNAGVFLLGALLAALLYFLFEGCIYSWGAAAVGVLPNVAQGALSAAAAWTLSVALSRLPR